MIQSSARNSILGIYEWIQLSASLLCDNRRISRKKSYRISSIRRRSCSLPVSVGLLYITGLSFIGKPADINDDWIRYLRAIQRRLLDVGSSTRNLSVLLSAMEELYNTNSPSASPVSSSELFTYVCVCCVLLRLLFEGGV